MSDKLYKILSERVKKIGGPKVYQRAPGSEVQIAYSVEMLCPQVRYITVSSRKLSASQQTQISKERGKKSLRELAKEYGVSYETVRRVLNTPR